MLDKKKLITIGGGSMIVLPGMVATIVSYILLYKVLTISSAQIVDPRLEETLSLLKKCALGAFICILISKSLRGAANIPYHILQLIMTISILKLSDEELQYHPDLPFLKKLSMIYVISISICFGLCLVAGGGYLYFKKVLANEVVPGKSGKSSKQKM